MPEYDWSCSCCKASNPSKNDACENCNHPAETTGWETEARIFAIEEMLGGFTLLGCPECGESSHNIEYSEKPVDYFHTGRHPTFRILNVISECLGCNHRIEKEFKVPFFRKFYRKIFGKDIKSKFLKGI